jgi:uncharacterized membrane protein YfcA
MTTELNWLDWIGMMVAATGIGVAKSGLSGVSMVHVLVFATIFQARESTGIVLPMLIIGDVCAILAYGQHADWQQVKKLLPPAVVGVVFGWLWMHRLEAAIYRPLIGLIILGLTLLQLLRQWRTDWQDRLPHSHGFAWLMGMLVGLTTMLANAAGPIFSLYLLALSIPKLAFVGTSAWFFLVLNSLKVPFSWQLGLIDWQSLKLNLLLSPLIVVGLMGGRAIVRRLPQRIFDSLILIFTAVASIWLLSTS